MVRPRIGWRETVRLRLRRLRATWVSLAQTAVAAGLAWVVAHDVIGHPRAFFAPIAAVIALGVAPGQSVRRAVELAVGVALGILVGDAIVAVIGTGPAQIAVVVLLATAGAVLLGGGSLAIGQAAGSAILVATLQGP